MKNYPENIMMMGFTYSTELKDVGFDQARKEKPHTSLTGPNDGIKVRIVQPLLHTQVLFA